MMTRSALLKSALAALLLALAWAVLSLGMADHYAKTQPERALFWRSQHPEALYQSAEVAAGRGDWASARSFAERGLKANPLDGRNLRVLAQAAAAQGKPELALELFQNASRLAPRDLPSHAWLLEHALRNRQAEPAVRHLDTLLRLRPSLLESLKAQAAAMAVNPATQPFMVAALGKAPPWRGAFLASLAQSQWPTQELAGFFLALSTASGLEPSEFQPWLTRLRNEKRFEQAYVTWANLIPEAQRPYLGNVFDGGFELMPETYVGDYAWRRRTVDYALTFWTAGRGTVGESSYMVQFEGQRSPFMDLEQSLVLPPGQWQLRWRAKANQLNSPRGLVWRVVCENDNQALADSEPMLGHYDWRELHMDFTVPPGCAGQGLSLLIPARIPAETQISGSLWLDALTIEPRTE